MTSWVFRITLTAEGRISRGAIPFFFIRSNLKCISTALSRPFFQTEFRFTSALYYNIFKFCSNSNEVPPSPLTAARIHLKIL